MSPPNEEIVATLTEIIGEFAEELQLEIDEIQPNALLIADLGLTSIELIHIMTSFNMRFKCRIAFDGLLLDPRFSTDVSLQNLADFIEENFDQQPSLPVMA